MRRILAVATNQAPYGTNPHRTGLWIGELVPHSRQGLNHPIECLAHLSARDCSLRGPVRRS